MDRALTDTTPAPAGTRTTAAGRRRAAQHPISKARDAILIVDNDPDACTILRLFLTAEGFEVITAQSVPAALSYVREYLPGVIITDYMPEATGPELCQELRSHPRTRTIPIILHTACDHADDSLYDQVFEKPTDLSRLSYAIRRTLGIPHSSAKLRVPLESSRIARPTA